MRKKRGAYRVSVREGDHLEDQGLNERIMVTWMFEK
jgi:hypothetical protein